jgi:hypothetical protein
MMPLCRLVLSKKWDQSISGWFHFYIPFKEAGGSERLAPGGVLVHEPGPVH